MSDSDIYSEYANESWDNDPDRECDWYWEVNAEIEEDPNLFGRLITDYVNKDWWEKIVHDAYWQSLFYILN